MTSGGQMQTVAAGSAGHVDRCPRRHVVEDAPHDRALDVEELVARLVVEGSPARVALPGSDRTCLDAVAQIVAELEERADLAEAGEGEVAVVGARESAQERDPLEPEEVRKRVLVDTGVDSLDSDEAPQVVRRYPRT